MKKLVLLGMAAFVLGACGNSAQEQVEADVESSAVESSEEEVANFCFFFASFF